MKIYVSGPPVTEVDKSKTETAEIYRAIARKFGKDHSVALPVRTHQLDALAAPDFFGEMSRRIGIADCIITVVQAGDQSTPVEATIAAASNRKPQFILEIDDAPRLMRGLPGVVGRIKYSSEKLEHQLDEAFEKLLAAAKPAPEAEAA